VPLPKVPAAPADSLPPRSLPTPPPAPGRTHSPPPRTADRIPAGEASPASRHAPAPPSLPPVDSSPRPKTWHTDAMFTRGHGVCVYYCSTCYKSVRVGGGGNNGGHVLRETTSRSLCGLVYPSRTSERGVCEVTEFRVPLTRRLRCVFFIMCVLLLWSRVRSGLNTVQSGKPCARLLSLGLSQIKSA
jgi:hypothetical protein